MTDQELGIKVLQHMGWRLVEDDPVRHPYYVKDGRMIRVDSFADYAEHQVDDLNAMHEAEKVFVQPDGCVWGPKWESYCDNLARVCCLAMPPNCLCRATARQRAEAFVKTVEGK